jgi:hypothetical protein
VAEPTRSALRQSRWELEPRPEVPLKGKTEAVSLYAPLLDQPAHQPSRRAEQQDPA